MEEAVVDVVVELDVETEADVVDASGTCIVTVTVTGVTLADSTVPICSAVPVASVSYEQGVE